MSLGSQDRNLIRASIAEYIRKNHGEDERKRLMNAPLQDQGGHWRALADELGVFSLTFPEEAGGLGGGLAEHVLVLEEFGKFLVLEPYLPTIVIAGSVLRSGDYAEAEAAIDKIMAGDLKIAFAYSEAGARYNLAKVSTTARLEGDHYIVNGQKTVVLDAPRASHLVLSARTSGTPGDEQGISLFMIDKSAAGITCRDYRTISGGWASDIALDDVSVPAKALMTQEGKAYPALELAVDEATVALCGEALGVMSRLLEDTVEYTKQRKQFGNTLSSYQALQHRMADMLIAREHSTSLVIETIEAMSGDADERRKMVSACKVFVNKSLRFIGQNAVQLHGGMGVTDELAVGSFFKRATEMERQFGDSDHHYARYDRVTNG